MLIIRIVSAAVICSMLAMRMRAHEDGSARIGHDWREIQNNRLCCWWNHWTQCIHLFRISGLCIWPTGRTQHNRKANIIQSNRIMRSCPQWTHCSIVIWCFSSMVMRESRIMSSFNCWMVSWLDSTPSQAVFKCWKRTWNISLASGNHPELPICYHCKHETSQYRAIQHNVPSTFVHGWTQCAHESTCKHEWLHYKHEKHVSIQGHAGWWDSHSMAGIMLAS